MKIKNWSDFQHYKDRNPPWIKLHKTILDDPEWFTLPPQDAKVLVMLWLLASEDEKKEGHLPCIKKIAFRLRTTEEEIAERLRGLTHWVEHDASDMIEPSLHRAVPETETEERRDRDNVDASTSPASSSGPRNSVPFEEIISYLNEKAEKKFNPKTKLYRKHIRARWKEGYTLEDFKDVIDCKVRSWGTSSTMVDCLRPQTLFSTNFDAYLQDAAKGGRVLQVQRCEQCLYYSGGKCKNLLDPAFNPAKCKSYIEDEWK